MENGVGFGNQNRGKSKRKKRERERAREKEKEKFQPPFANILALEPASFSTFASFLLATSSH